MTDEINSVLVGRSRVEFLVIHEMAVRSFFHIQTGKNRKSKFHEHHFGPAGKFSNRYLKMCILT